MDPKNLENPGKNVLELLDTIRRRYPRRIMPAVRRRTTFLSRTMREFVAYFTFGRDFMEDLTSDSYTIEEIDKYLKILRSYEPDNRIREIDIRNAVMVERLRHLVRLFGKNSKSNSETQECIVAIIHKLHLPGVIDLWQTFVENEKTSLGAAVTYSISSDIDITGKEMTDNVEIFTMQSSLSSKSSLKYVTPLTESKKL
ncbi:hypothetical protein HK096_010561, partial [Nowakowskiella sp. JEL0078]